MKRLQADAGSRKPISASPASKLLFGVFFAMTAAGIALLACAAGILPAPNISSHAFAETRESETATRPAIWDFGYPPQSDSVDALGIVDYCGTGLYAAHEYTRWGEMISKMQIGDEVRVSGKTYEVVAKDIWQVGDPINDAFELYPNGCRLFQTCIDGGDGGVWIVAVV
ncbi:MAG: hypothetical protein BZ138_06140 [Methanosphaera sp. rholeuAM270]|nr:MAG: hypothetical protein BZ138_06140 [Methanosphaera sp. rholeuAM270]